MRILIGHNYYQQAGGEDAVFRSHASLLKSKGHEVCLYERHNDEIKPGFRSKISHALSLRWSKASYEEVRSLIRTFKPDIAHFHNVFFVMSPSVFYACKDEGVPVVVSLHNFRLMCLNGLFFRDGRPCEDCLTGLRMPGIIHRCYRGSMAGSMLAEDMINHHWRRKTWENTVDCFVLATEFSRGKYVRAGIPAERIKVLPHFLPKPLDQENSKGEYALYAGRLSQEKGIDLLLDAWAGLKGIPLYIVGGGPKQKEIEERIARQQLNHIKLMGFLQSDAYDRILSEAKLMVVPSVCYENFPRVVVEAYAHGVPVLANRIGTMAEIVEEGATGMLFNDAEDLVKKAGDYFADDGLYQRMSSNALKTYASKYSADRYYSTLMGIYQEAMHA